MGRMTQNLFHLENGITRRRGAWRLRKLPLAFSCLRLPWSPGSGSHRNAGIGPGLGLVDGRRDLHHAFVVVVNLKALRILPVYLSGDGLTWACLAPTTVPS